MALGKVKNPVDAVPSHPPDEAPVQRQIPAQEVKVVALELPRVMQSHEVIDLTLSDTDDDEVDNRPVWGDGEDQIAHTTKLLEALQPEIFRETQVVQTSVPTRTLYPPCAVE